MQSFPTTAVVTQQSVCLCSYGTTVCTFMRNVLANKPWSLQRVRERGGTIVKEPWVESDSNGSVKMAVVQTVSCRCMGLVTILDQCSKVNVLLIIYNSGS